MRILFFNRSFYPDLEATGQFLTELCEDLSNEHFITVIAGSPYQVKTKRNLFPIKREKYRSIEILRAQGTTFSKRFSIARIANLISYFTLAFFGGFLVKKRPNIVVAQTDPPILGLLGIFFSKFYKAKFIYYCKDIYPDVGIITGEIKSKLISFILEMINRISFKKANNIICIGNDMKKRIISKGVDESKIEIVYDWADTKNICPVEGPNPFRLKYNLNDKFLVVYSGNIGLSQELDKAIEVAKILKTNKKLLFIFIGEGVNKVSLQRLVKKLNLSNVIFLPYQSRSDLRHSLSGANLHLITLKKGLSGVVVPSKVYGILACGRPFIGWVDEDSEITPIAKRFNCGIIVPPGDIEAMASAINWCLKNPKELEKMGENGREAAVKFFDREMATVKFNKILEALNEG